MDEDSENPPDNDLVKTELLAAGFVDNDVIRAFDWLESLASEDINVTPQSSSSFRIFSPFEKERLDVECQDLMMTLERTGILNSINRELILDRAIALEEVLSLEKLKWIVLIVLLNQPNEELALARMEDIIYDLVPTYVH
ncbi:protein Smg [Methylococcaceae bacterium]|nr:protein Smg [Methylococcaceae bacterium]